MNTIQVEIAYQYGTKRVYVVDGNADAIRALTGSKTLTELHIKALKALGFEFVVANQETV